MEIVAFTERYRAGLIRLWRDCGLVIPDNDSEADLNRKLAYQPELLLVALHDDRLAGSVMVGYEGHRGWINYLAVDPELRGRGIASRLLKAAEEKLRALGCPKINLMVRTGNKDVVRFYEGQGYAVEERIAMGRRLD